MRGVKILPLLIGVLVLSAGCTPASQSDPGAPPTGPDGPVDPLTEAAEAGPSWEVTSPEFCAGVAALTSENTRDGAITLDQVIARYHELLPLAPLEITVEIEALLDYLTSGTPPEFAAAPPDPDAAATSPPRASHPFDEDTEPESDEWHDDVLYGTGDAEQLAVTLAAFLEFRCRGTAVNPLPAATGLENQTDD